MQRTWCGTFHQNLQPLVPKHSLKNPKRMGTKQNVNPFICIHKTVQFVDFRTLTKKQINGSPLLDDVYVSGNWPKAEKQV